MFRISLVSSIFFFSPLSRYMLLVVIASCSVALCVAFGLALLVLSMKRAKQTAPEEAKKTPRRPTILDVNLGLLVNEQ